LQELSNVHPLIFAISLTLQIFVLLYGGYYFGVSLFGWYNRKNNAKADKNDIHTFALVVAAHNEEVVIGNMVDSLNKLNYPREAYDIFVIADNCTDKTAENAAAKGAIVFERENKDLRGKGYALEWMFDKIFKMDKKYDYVSIFDADNIVDENYLAAMNNEVNKGYKVVQGYIDSKNPFDSWITCAYSISFWSISRLFQTARYNLGVTCQLSGTGFILETELLKRIGWKATCLTEDMEFTARLALEGEKVGWAYHAKVYDEKPLTMSQSWKQRVRWMQGHADVASRFSVKLFAKAIKDRDWSAFDCGIYLLNPLKVLCVSVITFMAWAQTFYPDGNLGFFQLWYLFENPFVWNAFVAVEFLYMPIVITIEKKCINKKLIWGYITYSIYSLTWMPITVIGCINKNKKEWFHTQHTREISIADVEKIQ